MAGEEISLSADGRLVAARHSVLIFRELLKTDEAHKSHFCLDIVEFLTLPRPGSRNPETFTVRTMAWSKHHRADNSEHTTESEIYT